MAIIQQPDALSLSGNLKKFIVSSGETVSFVLKDGSTVLLDATYEPGSDSRVTIDVQDIVESRLSFLITHENFYQQQNVVKTFTAVIDGTEYTFRAIRAGVANLGDTPGNWLKGNFLTWQPTSKPVTYYSPEWLTYYAVEACTIKLKATFPDNTEQTVTIGSCEVGKAFTCNLQYAVVAGLLGQLYPSYFEVWAENAAGTRLTYIQRYMYSELKSEQEQWFLFENSLGGLDTIRAYGDTDFEGDHVHNISSIDGTSSEYRIDTKRSYNQNTGYLNEYERRWLLDFFPSQNKFVHSAGAIRSVIVTDSDVKYTASDLPSSYNFKYQFSDDSAGLLNLIRNEDQIPEVITIPDLDSPDFSLPPRLSEYPRVQLHGGVIIPAFDPNSSNPTVTTLAAIIASAIGETIDHIPGSESGGQLVKILKTLDESPATDENVFSSLRVIAEILKNNETFKDLYLSKRNDDTAQGIIKFIKGIEVGQFISGLFGSGASLKNDNGISRLEVDHLLVRMRAEFFSILVNNAKHVGGQQINSAANMICIKVEETTDFYRCYFDTGNNNEVINLFENTDRARCQVFTGSGQKFYWRKVLAVGLNYIELSKTDCAPGTNDVPAVGDHIFQLGSDNPDRQGAWITSSVGPDAPYMKQYSGIDGYTLADKELTIFTRLGNRIVGKTVFLSTGQNLEDWSTGTAQDIQDAQGAANAAALAAQQAIDDAAANVGLINTEVGKLQAQIDGEVSNWFYPYSPALANYPASDWTTNAIKDRHIGDTFTNTQQAPATDAGKSWRFVKNASVYSWTLIADSDAVLALQKAAQAQSTADGKSTTYLIQPTSYKFGDMWVLAADQTVNGIAYKSGEILTATQDSTAFVQAHWVKKVRYTDDTAVNNLEIGGRNLITSKSNMGIWVGEREVKITIGAFIYLNPAPFKKAIYQIEVRAIDEDIIGGTFGWQWLGLYQGDTIELSAEWQRVVSPYFDSSGAIGLRCSKVGRLELRNIQAEHGNKPTDWSPAPEDVQAAIDAAVVRATYWSVKASAPVIYKDAINAATSGTHTPVTVSGELRSGTTTTAGGFITVTPNGGAEAGTASASPVTIAPANGDGKTSYTVRLYDTASKTTLLDTMTIPVVFKGASGVNAINVVLSNEADVLPASPEGVVSDYSGSGIIIRVFEGATELDYDGTGTANGKFNVTASATGITAGAKSESGLTCVFANASNMTADNATITFTIAGKTADGASFSLTKTQSFAKSRTGQKGDTGASAPLLYLSASAQVMKCNPDNTPQAGQTISIEAKLQNVSGTATFVATPYNDAGTAQTVITLGGTGNTRTLTNSQWLAAYKRIEIVATLGSLTDKVTIYRVADGATGKGISGTEIKYQVGTSGTTAPTGTWLTSVPTVPEGQFLWTRTITSYTDSTTTTSYSVSKQGVSGAAGKGISSTVVTYQASSSGTVVPTDTWTETVPSVSENQFLWTRTVITYTDSSASTSYSVGKMGAKGDAGQNAIVGLLTNESVTLQANSAGAVSSFAPANGEFWVYNGVTKVTSGITFSKVSETGCTAAITSSGSYSVSAMSADNATVMLRAVYSGVTIDKVLTLSKSKAGADGVSISVVDVEFSKNTSPTTAPTTGWTTTAPTLAEGEQLWTRTKTTYSSGNPTYSTPANITPKTGATGQGIDSVTEQFILSSSKITQPAEGDVNWSTTQPAWIQGQYIWSRVKVVYKNPAQTIYTGYAVSSEWEAVNNMNIGSRNFWLNSALISKSATTAAWSIASRDLTGLIENGAQVTIQFDINVDAPFNIVLYAANQSPIVFGTTLLTNLANFNLVSGKQTIKHTFNFDSSKPFIHIYKNSAELRTATVTFLMLGLGNKVTWSEAQEDIDLRINTAKQEALTAAGNAQTSANTANTAVGNLNAYVDGSFKDGVIEASEAKAIEKYINVVNTEKSNLEATYNTLYVNTYLEGTAKTDLLNAKVTYFGAVDTLLNSINTAITDGRTTVAEKQAVDTNYSSYKTALASLQTAIENANKAIQTKLDTLSTDRVNNLQIGFNNLLRLSNVPIVSVGTYLAGSYNRSGTFENGKTYTLVFKSTLNVRAFISSNVQIGNSVSGVNRMVFTYTGQALADQTIKFYNTSASYATQVTIDFACLYEGDVKAPSIWTESPADVQARIDAEKARIDNMLSDNIADPKEKQNLKLLWDEIAKEYPTIKSKAVSYGISTTNYDSTYTALNNILSPLFVNMAINTSVVGTDVRTAYANYMEQKLLINQTITDTINGKANDAKLTAEQAQLAADGYMRARYVRDWIQGNTDNTANQWADIRIINKAGSDIALGKSPTSNGTWNPSYPASNATDGNTETFAQIPGTTPATLTYAQIDLGQVYYDIDYIRIIHPASLGYGRTYFGTKTEISTDGVNWTPVFDSAKSGTYKETAAGNIISFRPNEVLAKVLKGAAVTDKFGATISGALIGAVMIILRELNSMQETAGISGIQGALNNYPSLWAGGTYAKAMAVVEFLSKISAGTTPSNGEYDNLAKITFLHNGAAKVGDFIIEESGRIVMVHPDTGKERLVFNVMDIPLVADLMSQNTDGDSVINAGSLSSTTSTTTLPNTVTVTKTGSELTVSGTCLASGSLNIPSHSVGEVGVSIYLYKNGAYYQTIISDGDSLSTESPSYSNTTAFSKKYTVDKGTYSIVISRTFLNCKTSSGGLSGNSTLSWSFVQSGVRYFQFGLNGFMAFFENNHAHFTELEGWDLRGKTNMPGVLLSGSVGLNGGFNTVWGAKKHASSTAIRNALGQYTVYHSVGHSDYSVQITSETSGRAFYVPTANKGTSSFVVYFTNLSGAAADANFSFQITGRNY